MPAAIALHADEAVFQAAAGEIAVELIQHKPGQRPLAVGEAALEGRQAIVLSPFTAANATFALNAAV